MTAAVAGACAAAFVLVVWGGGGGRVRALVPARARPGVWGWRALAPRPAAFDLAAFLDELARRVRSGASPAEALAAGTAAAGPTVPAPLRAAVERHRRGLALADACRPLVDEPDPGLALTGATLCAVARFGGGGGRALDAAASALRERAALAAEVRAQAATARLSALVLVVLPVGFAGWTLAVDAGARAFLLGGPVGWSVATAGLALDALGAWWMRRLVRAAAT